MRTISTIALALVLVLATAARSQTPQNLPVVFENDDPRDGLYEAATDAVTQIHFEESVPVALLVVPCGPGSSLDPYRCVTGTFHQRYKDWIALHPGLVEIGQHGLMHTESFGTLTRAQQLDLIDKGLQEMKTWGLPQGRPFTFAPPFSSENADTISVLEQLGFRVSVRNSDTCLPSPAMPTFCESISLCARDVNGKRVAGPSCVLLPPATLISQVNARQGDGKVFLTYHVQDLLLPDLVTIDQAKLDAFRAILRAFHDEQSAGRYRLMTYETYYGTVAPPPDLWVYRDALATPWIDSSWSATVDYDNASPVFTGARSIKVVETGWGALSVHRGDWGATQPIDPSRYQGVDFSVRTSSASFKLAVQLENDARNPFPVVVSNTIPANQWVDVSVSMSRLNPAGQSFDRVDVFDYNGASLTYFVDDLHLVSQTTGPTPTPLLPTPTPVPPTPPLPTPTPSSSAPPSPTVARTPTLPAATPSATPTAAADLWVYRQWTTVSVPVSQLDPGGQPFDRLGIRDFNGVSRTYFVDELRFVGQ